MQEIVVSIAVAVVGSLLYASTNNAALRLAFLFLALTGLDYATYMIKDLTPTTLSLHYTVLVFSLMLFAALTLSLLLGLRK